MNNCEVFDRKRCFGCVGLDPQYDIESIKNNVKLIKKK